MSDVSDAYHKKADALAFHIIGLFAASDVPPSMACLVASKIIGAAINEIKETKLDLAQAILGDLAGGLVEMMQGLGMAPSETGGTTPCETTTH
jgi:hypothetical protein